MKKILFPALALTGALIITLTGCSLFGENPYEVADRDDAANITLSQTESKSQVRLMYEEACKDGYSKSFVEFIQELGALPDDAIAVNGDLLCSAEVYAAFDVMQFGGSAVYYSIGAGVFLDVDRERGDAYVVTNYHVVYNQDSLGREYLPHISDRITLYLYGARTDGRGISAEYVGGVMSCDLAVLKVENSDELKDSDARAATFFDSDEVSVGEKVYAVGNPNKKGLSAVSGILSVDAEYITTTAADERTSVTFLEMRTDAPVNHGNSGGGLFNAAGELIGIVNARSEESGVEHLGYAIPVNLVLAVTQNIIDNSKADNSHGAMRADPGFTVKTADSWSEYDEASGRARVKERVEIEKVGSGLAAGKLSAGDVLLSVKIGGEEKEITRRHMFTVEMFRVRRGDVVTFTVLRGGKEVSVDLSFSSADDFTLFQ